MTVPAQSTLFNESVANGLTSSFPYEFKIASADDITVMLDGVAQTTGFTVTGIGDDVGGSIVFSVAPANGVVVLRYLDPVFNREENYPQFGDFNADVVNLDFDRIWLALQSMVASVRRSLKLPVSTSTDQALTENAATRANRGIKFDASGNLVLSDYDPDAAQGSAADAAASAASAALSEALAAASAASIPSMTGGADTVLVINPTNNGWLYKTATQMRTFLGLGTAATQDTTAFQSPLTAASQAEMEAGTEANIRSMSPLRVSQAIAAQACRIVATSPGTASGTNVDITSIPSWAKKITINFDGVSTGGTSALLLQLGDSGGIESTGYTGMAALITSGGVNAYTGVTSGFPLTYSTWNASSAAHGSVTLTHVGGNAWAISGSLMLTVLLYFVPVAGTKTLSATLTQLRITTVSGDTFDGGNINAVYEG